MFHVALDMEAHLEKMGQHSLLEEVGSGQSALVLDEKGDVKRVVSSRLV